MLKVKSEAILGIRRNAQYIIDSICSESSDEANLIREVAGNILGSVSMIEKVMAVVRSKNTENKE